MHRARLLRMIKQPLASTGQAPLVIATGTLEAMKWLALVLMTLDHVNKYLLQYRLAALFAMGRGAMPLFAFVLAYNLARPDALAGGALWRTARRLLGYGMAASVPVMALRDAHGWWPLNIMFTLLVAACVIGLLAVAAWAARRRSWCSWLVAHWSTISGSRLPWYWFAGDIAGIPRAGVWSCSSLPWPSSRSSIAVPGRSPRCH